MAEDIAIKVEHVSKDFLLPHEKITSVKSAFTGMFNRKRTKESQHALKDISFEIKKGEFFGIVGRNGSGKSTMLKILAGIYQPTSGSVRANGKLVPFIELGVGFNPELSGRENVFLNGALLGFSRSEIAAMYQDIVDFAELQPFMDQKLKNYSSGMQVRLAFSVATRAKADILLIDEVLAVGDADFQRKCYNYFNKLKSSETTVIFISHDMSAVREYCDRAMFIEKSKMVAIGSTEEIAERYTRLFMDPQSDSGNNELSDRWGDQSLHIKKVTTSIDKTTLSITVAIKANKDFEKPVVGLRIRDSGGIAVTGTNTKQEKFYIPDLRAGENRELQWQLPNVFRDGQYSIDIALQYSDAITVADWWNNASQLIIKKERRLPYPVDPGFQINIK